jgi:hypothetical protein
MAKKKQFLISDIDFKREYLLQWCYSTELMYLSLVQIIDRQKEIKQEAIPLYNHIMLLSEAQKRIILEVFETDIWKLGLVHNIDLSFVYKYGKSILFGYHPTNKVNVIITNDPETILTICDILFCLMSEMLLFTIITEKSNVVTSQELIKKYFRMLKTRSPELEDELRSDLLASLAAYKDRIFKKTGKLTYKFCSPDDVLYYYDTQIINNKSDNLEKKTNES